MTDNNRAAQKSLFWYWFTTGLLAFGMLAGGIAQIMQFKVNADGIIHLGYPLYFLRIIGVWKIFGVIAILIPGYLLLKEWAYAGLFFAMTGAVISHIASGDRLIQFLAPFIFAGLTVLSWHLRPVNRKLKVSITRLQNSF